MELIENPTKSSFSQRSIDLIIANKERIHTYANRAIAASLVIISVAYIGTINDLSVKGFVLQELRGKVTELSAENERSEIAAMELESFDRISARASKLGMQKIDELRYASRVDGKVAIR